MDVYDAPEAQTVTRLREAERERDELRRRVAELEAAPGGVAVAGLLAELERERDSAKQCRALAAADGKPEIAAEYAGRHDATVRDIALIRHRLGQPTPEQKAAAEVLACDPHRSVARDRDHRHAPHVRRRRRARVSLG